MQRERGIRLWESGEQAVLEHRLGAPKHFFGRLGDEQQRAVPLALQAGERVRGPDPTRHVQVVAAAVRHERLLTKECGLDLARIRQGGFLLHRQCVQLGAYEDGGPLTVAQQAHDAGLADALGHLEAQSAQRVGQPSGRKDLLEGEFRLGVNVLVQALDAGVVVPISASTALPKRTAWRNASIALSLPGQRRPAACLNLE